MDEYIRLQHTIIKKTLWLALGMGLIFMVMNRAPLAKGLALGALFSVLDLKLMAAQLRRRLMGLQRAKDHLCTLGRFALLSVPLILAIKLPDLDFFAAIAGLLSVKLVILYLFTRK